jgi:hypothetical protein
MKVAKRFFLIGAFFMVSILVNAYPLPNDFIRFEWVTGDSGFLVCGGEGTCANVVGNKIYFSHYVGEWNGSYSSGPNGETHYPLENVEDEE